MANMVRFHEFGGPDVLRIETLPVAEPARGEVRIAVDAIGLNRVEAMFRSGYFGTPALPSTIGYEAAGTIDVVGSDVTGFAVGDRVATLPGLSMEQYGTYGDSILFPADMLVKIPEGQSMPQAAATWMQYLTAYALIAIGNIDAGDTVVITAASSSVGLAAIQIANAAGAVPIAVTRGRSKVDGLVRLGAAHVVVSEEQDVARTVMEITGGRGTDIAFDAVGGQPLANLLNAMAPKGIVILYGLLAGAEVTLPLQQVMLNNFIMRGFSANELLLETAQRKSAIAYIHEGVTNGRLTPVIDRTFALHDVVEAHRYLESNQQLGKIVLTMN